MLNFLLFIYRQYSEEDLPERPPPPSEKDNMPFSGEYYSYQLQMHSKSHEIFLKKLIRLFTLIAFLD